MAQPSRRLTWVPCTCSPTLLLVQTGKTPLMVAARAGKEAIAAALLDAGAKASLQDASGKTALDYARLKKRHYIVELLQVPFRCVDR